MIFSHSIHKVSVKLLESTVSIICKLKTKFYRHSSFSFSVYECECNRFTGRNHCNAGQHVHSPIYFQSCHVVARSRRALVGREE